MLASSIAYSVTARPPRIYRHGTAALYRAPYASPHADVGEVVLAAAAVGTAILAAFGCDWGDVADWIGGLFSPEERNAQGLTAKGAQADAYAKAYNPADHEAQFTDEARVKAIVAQVSAPGQIGPQLGHKIWMYWVNVVKPKRELEARQLGEQEALARARAEARAAELARKEALRKKYENVNLVANVNDKFSRALVWGAPSASSSAALQQAMSLRVPGTPGRDEVPVVTTLQKPPGAPMETGKVIAYAGTGISLLGLLWTILRPR